MKTECSRTRTGSAADPEDISKGQYSVFYTAVPQGAGFTDSAWIDGLQQNEENRSNLALVNTGEVDDSESVFSLEIYDGETSQLVATVSNADTTVAAKQWHPAHVRSGNHTGLRSDPQGLRRQSLPGLRSSQRRRVSRREDR